MNDQFFRLILSRRPVEPEEQMIPAPDVGAVRLATIAACHVPTDMEKLPFRWVEVVSRDRLAGVFESALPAEATEEERQAARARAKQSPACMALIGPRNTPEDGRTYDEALMMAGASLMNFLGALHAQGFVAKTIPGEDFPAPDGLYNPSYEKLLSLIFIGTPTKPLDYYNIGMGNDERQPLTRW